MKDSNKLKEASEGKAGTPTNNYENTNIGEEETEKADKICWFIQPRGILLERHNYSLYVFGPDNP